MRKYPSIIVILLIMMTLILNNIFEIPTYILIVSIILGVFLYMGTNYTLNIISIAILLATISVYSFQNSVNKFDYSINNKNYSVTGVVKKVKVRQENISYVLTDVNISNSSFNEDILIYTEDINNLIDIGSKISFNSKLYVPYNNSNPGNFNYYNYLLAQNIYAYSYVDDIIKIGDSNDGILNMQNLFSKKINNIFEMFSTNNREFIISVFTGNNILSKEHNELYRETGITHILAVSGFHIVLIQTVLLFILGFLHIDKNIKRALILFLIFIYCILIGFPSSAFRAFIFLLVDLISSILNKPKVPIKTLSLAAIITLLIKPTELLNIGFQFSFLASLGIILIYPIFKNKKYKNNDLINNFYLILSINILIIPLQLYYFKDLTIGVFVSNLAVIPLLILVIYLGLFFIAIYKISIISIFVRKLSQIIYSICLFILKGLNKIFNPIENRFIINIYDIIIIFSVIFIFVLIIYNYRVINKFKMVIFKTMILLIPLHIVFSIYLQDFKSMEKFSMINIGQGDCFLLETLNNNILFDTGGSLVKSNSSKNLIETLKYNKINKIDGIFLSHFDEDHSGNLLDLLEEYGDIPIFGRNNGEKQLIDKYKLENIDYRNLIEDSTIEIDGVNIGIIQSEYINSNENDNSVVIKLNIKDCSILLTGDIEDEFKILNKDIQSDILKIPHHGSKTSSKEEFIDRVKPDIALLSVGANNMYNLPNGEVMDRYDHNGIIVKRTDLDGMVTIDIHDGYYRVYSSNGRFIDRVNGKAVLFCSSYYLLLIIVLKIYLSRYVDERYENKNLLGLW